MRVPTLTHLILGDSSTWLKPRESQPHYKVRVTHPPLAPSTAYPLVSTDCRTKCEPASINIIASPLPVDRRQSLRRGRCPTRAHNWDRIRTESSQKAGDPHQPESQTSHPPLVSLLESNSLPCIPIRSRADFCLSEAARRAGPNSPVGTQIRDELQPIHERGPRELAEP